MLKALTLPNGRTVWISTFDKKIDKHEAVHRKQVKAKGSVKYALDYLFDLLHNGYLSHPMEKEADRANKRPFLSIVAGELIALGFRSIVASMISKIFLQLISKKS